MATSTQSAPGASVLGVAKPRRGEQLIQVLLFAAAIVSVITTVGIVISLFGETLLFFREVGIIEYFTGTQWSPLFTPAEYGILPLLNGTLLVSGIALIVAIPLGLGSAIYLSEYASSPVRRVIKPIIELLAGVPTIVFGYFALTFFTPNVLRGVLGLQTDPFNALAAGIVTGFLVLPTIATLAEDAMTAVPRALREGAYGLGAAKLQVSIRVVFPAALSGIVAAVVLGASRAIGETMIATVAAGLRPTLTLDPTSQVETMTAFIAATGKGDVPTESIGFKTIFAVGATLFVGTLLINTVAIRFVRRYRQVYE